MMSICIILFKTYFAFASTAGSIVCSAFTCGGEWWRCRRHRLFASRRGDRAVWSRHSASASRSLRSCIPQAAGTGFPVPSTAGGVVVDKEFFAIEFGAAVDEWRNAVGDQIAAEIVVVEYAAQ